MISSELFGFFLFLITIMYVIIFIKFENQIKK